MEAVHARQVGMHEDQAEVGARAHRAEADDLRVRLGFERRDQLAGLIDVELE